jgi:hypothetical protein
MQSPQISNGREIKIPSCRRAAQTALTKNIFLKDCVMGNSSDNKPYCILWCLHAWWIPQFSCSTQVSCPCRSVYVHGAGKVCIVPSSQMCPLLSIIHNNGV